MINREKNVGLQQFHHKKVEFLFLWKTIMSNLLQQDPRGDLMGTDVLLAMEEHANEFIIQKI